MSITKITNDKFKSTQFSFSIITFDEIFKLVAITVINIIYNIYGNLDPIKNINSDVKKIITYSILEQIYKRMILEKGNDYILYINTSFTTNFSEIWTYANKEKLSAFIIKTCKAISKNIPIPVLIENKNIDLTKDCGETKNTLNKLENALNKFKLKITSLQKLKKYCKTNGLIDFIDKYHCDDDIKKNFFYYKYLKGT